MLSDLNRNEVREEGNLLIEAVSLLVQRQRETESWIAEQIGQAEERATATEGVYAEFAARLASIEEHLARLVRDVEPLRDDLGVDERLERLREQVEGLKSSADPRTVRATPSLAVSPAPVPAPEAPASPRSAPEPGRLSTERRASGTRPAVDPRPRAAPGSGPGVSFWELFGTNRQDRFGFVLIGAGAVAVLYAILTQLRFG